MSLLGPHCQKHVVFQTNALVKQELNEAGRVFIIDPLVEKSDMHNDTYRYAAEPLLCFRQSTQRMYSLVPLLLIT